MLLLTRSSARLFFRHTHIQILMMEKLVWKSTPRRQFACSYNRKIFAIVLMCHHQFWVLSSQFTVLGVMIEWCGRIGRSSSSGVPVDRMNPSVCVCLDIFYTRCFYTHSTHYMFAFCVCGMQKDILATDKCHWCVICRNIVGHFLCKILSISASTYSVWYEPYRGPMANVHEWQS